jgi:ferredoxin--NADP+ reductase
MVQKSCALKVVKYPIPDSAKTYMPKAPFIARLVANEQLTEPGSSDDIRNLVFDISGSGISYIEGQSIGVIPPSPVPSEKPERVRLYSIASSRKGDYGCGETVTLCVKRVDFVDKESGEHVVGLCSSFLCDLKVGDTVAFMGPTGRTFLLPEDHNTHLILVAAGTGIAPFRAFIKRVFTEVGEWDGQVRLFFGAKTGLEALYMNRENDDIGQYLDKETFKAFRAFSREEGAGDQYTRKGFVQHQIADNVEEIWELIRTGQFCFYLCGMKTMEAGVYEVFRERAAKDGLDWDKEMKRFKKQGRWNVEVY